MSSKQISKWVWGIALCAVVHAVHAYDPYKLAKAAGMYLSAADIQARFKNSKCGYAMKRVPPTIYERRDEILKVLNANDAREFNHYFNSSEFLRLLQSNQDFINQFMRNAVTDGLDRKTSCGMLAGAIGISVKAANDAWNEADKTP